MSNLQNDIHETADFFSKKILDEKEVRAAQANLMGFFMMLIEADKKQCDDNNNRSTDFTDQA